MVGLSEGSESGCGAGAAQRMELWRIVESEFSCEVEVVVSEILRGVRVMDKRREEIHAEDVFDSGRGVRGVVGECRVVVGELHDAGIVGESGGSCIIGC